jgi:diaminohydroxyphosphoribosylaminopyrimidine deaminase/5-amino-6-(5-phosphoribosylamino)uracil reductase
MGEGGPEARVLNQPYFTMMREGRPFVILKAATSLDGRIAEAPGLRTQLSSTVANRHVHYGRAEVDAIGVGIGTALVDDPELTPRGSYRERPLVRVVFDRRLRTPPSARLLSTRATGPVIIVTTAEAAECAELRVPLERAGAGIEVARDGTFRAALERLAARQVWSLLLEGGAALHCAAWDEDLVDIVSLYVTPHRLGEDGVEFLPGRSFRTTALHDTIVEPLGPDVLIEGYVHRSR